MQQPQSPKHATAAEVERATMLLLDALHASGYVKPRRAVSAGENVSTLLVRRLHLSTRDVEFWLGILGPADHMENGGERWSSRLRSSRQTPSMSSIQRDVKKKLRLDRRASFFL